VEVAQETVPIQAELPILVEAQEAVKTKDL
jgi:hypothetical protein